MALRERDPVGRALLVPLRCPLALAQPVALGAMEGVGREVTEGVFAGLREGAPEAEARALPVAATLRVPGAPAVAVPGAAVPVRCAEGVAAPEADRVAREEDDRDGGALHVADSDRETVGGELPLPVREGDPVTQALALGLPVADPEAGGDGEAEALALPDGGALPLAAPLPLAPPLTEALPEEVLLPLAEPLSLALALYVADRDKLTVLGAEEVAQREGGGELLPEGELVGLLLLLALPDALGEGEAEALSALLVLALALGEEEKEPCELEGGGVLQPEEVGDWVVDAHPLLLEQGERELDALGLPVLLVLRDALADAHGLPLRDPEEVSDTEAEGECEWEKEDCTESVEEVQADARGELLGRALPLSEPERDGEPEAWGDVVALFDAAAVELGQREEDAQLDVEADGAPLMEGAPDWETQLVEDIDKLARPDALELSVELNETEGLRVSETIEEGV